MVAANRHADRMGNPIEPPRRPWNASLMDILRLFWWLLLGAARGLGKVAQGAWWLARRLFRRRPNTFGSARWAGWFDVWRGGGFRPRGRAPNRHHGLIVGRFRGRMLRFSGEGAVLVAAPQGSGKGVGIVVPNLLDYPGSVVCTDPKGENAAITGAYRATLGPVYRLNAIEPGGSHRFNPMDMVRLGTLTEFDDAYALAELLVVPESTDPHWDTSARQVLAGCIMYVLRTRPPELRTLSTLAELLNSEGNTLRDTFMVMATSPDPTIAQQGRTALRGLDEDNEFKSVMNNTSKQLKMWAADRIAGQLTAASDFDMMALHDDRPMTVYVMVPEEFLRVYGPFLRVILGCAMAALVRGKGRARPRYRPLLLLDECQALGRLEALEHGVGYLREYARMIMVFQDFGRMRTLYGEDGADSFMAASGAQVVFGVNDLKTAQAFAEIIGHRTVKTTSAGQSQANTDLVRKQEQSGLSEAGRHLIDASEILRLPPRHAIVRMNTVRAPVLATKLRYFKVRAWKGRYGSWRGPDAPPPDVGEPPRARVRYVADPADAPGYPATPPAPRRPDGSGLPPGANAS